MSTLIIGAVVVIAIIAAFKLIPGLGIAAKTKSDKFADGLTTTSEKQQFYLDKEKESERGVTTNVVTLDALVDQRKENVRKAKAALTEAQTTYDTLSVTRPDLADHLLDAIGTAQDHLKNAEDLLQQAQEQDELGHKNLDKTRDKLAADKEQVKTTQGNEALAGAIDGTTQATDRFGKSREGFDKATEHSEDALREAKARQRVNGPSQDDQAVADALQAQRRAELKKQQDARRAGQQVSQ